MIRPAFVSLLTTASFPGRVGEWWKENTRSLETCGTPMHALAGACIYNVGESAHGPERAFSSGLNARQICKLAALHKTSAASLCNQNIHTYPTHMH